MALEDVAKLWSDVEKRVTQSRVFGGKQIPNVLTRTKAERELQFSFIEPDVEDSKERNRVIAAYEWRAKKIKEVEQLWVREQNPDKKRDLGRDIKGLVSTDPTTYEMGRNGPKWQHSHWKKGAKRPIEAHHRHGLDDYYEGWRGLEDGEHYRLAKSQAKKGNYYGMHSKNRYDVDRSLHVGRARQKTAGPDSIHGRLKYTRLTTQKEMQDYAYDPANRDIGSSDTLSGPSGGKRLQVPAWSQLNIDQRDEAMSWFSDRDSEAIEYIKTKKVQAPSLPGKIPDKIKKKVISQIPSDKMSSELKGALDSGNWDEAIKLADQEVPDFQNQRKIAGATKSADLLTGKWNKVELAFDIIDDISTGNYGRALLNLGRHTPVGRTASITWTTANALAQSRTGMTIPQRMMMTNEQRQAEALAQMEKNRQSNTALRKNVKNFFNLDEAKKQKADADIDQQIKNIDQTTEDVWKPFDIEEEKRYRWRTGGRPRSFGRFR